MKLQEAMLCTLASPCAPALGPGSGWLSGRDAEPHNAERAPDRWHVALVKATVGFRSGDFDLNMVLVKLIPRTNSAKNKGIKGERSKSSGWKVKLFSMYLRSTVQRRCARLGI